MEAATAKERKFPTTISKDAINELPLIRYDGEIEVVSNDGAVGPAIGKLRKERVLGFDTESRPAFKKGESYLPSVLQLAGSRTVYLFQLDLIKNPRPIQRLLASPKVEKAGVAIHDDIKKLQERFPFDPRGFVELSAITQEQGIVNTGLRSLVAIFLGGRVSKGAQVTNWSRRRLTQTQISYAATDAWISRELYLKLDKLKLA